MNRIKLPSHLFVKIVGVFVAVLLILPTLVVIPISFSDKQSFLFPPAGWSLRWYEEFFESRAWSGALQRSLLIGVLAALVATVLGTAAALGLAHLKSRRAAPGVRGLLLSPFVIPGIVLAIGVYTVFSMLGLVGTMAGFVLAHAALGLPYVLISVSAVLGAVNPNLQRAAAGLGASGWTVVRRITLPLIFPGVMAGALFAFVTSFDEILVSLFIRSPFLETLPVRMYTSVVNDTDPTIAAASTIVLLITTLVLLVAGQITTSRIRRMKGATPR